MDYLLAENRNFLEFSPAACSLSLSRNSLANQPLIVIFTFWFMQLQLFPLFHVSVLS